MLKIPPSLYAHEVEIKAIRAQGSGGQNINKVSCAVQLRFDVQASSLPLECKQALLARADQRLNKDGVIVIKAQEHRSLEQNRIAALARLHELITAAAFTPKARKPTRATRAAKRKRLDSKSKHSQTKALRTKPTC
jgi:ribosome-associated protein